MSEPMITTYSMWSKFRNCRKACYWRYFREIVPLEKSPNLSFGSTIHNCLELWHKRRDLDLTLDLIDRAYPNRSQNEREQADWHLATAMMRGYAARYHEEELDVIALEEKFQGKIINPITGASSRSFVLAGKVDGIVRIDGKYFLLEHKTASQVDSGYLERLWVDFQIILYAWYIEQTLKISIHGVLYNILVKAKLRQGRGETEGEFAERRAKLAAKSKRGTSSARRRTPESNESYQARLVAKYSDPEMFHRAMLYFSRDQFDTLRADLWELTQAMLDARRRGIFYQNTAYCFNYGRPCAYFPICRASGAEHVIENLYRHEPPHEELRDELSPSEDALPF